MDWLQFVQILADFIMKLVAFFKSSDDKPGNDKNK